MYAVIESGGKQYRVEKGTVLLVDRLEAEEGSKVTLRPVMLRDKEVVVAPDALAKAKVEAKVTEHVRGDKIKVFKYKPKKGYRRRAGFRAELTRLEITAVGAGTTSRKAPASKDAEEGATTAKKPAAKKPAAKKPAAKAEATTSKPAAKKPAAKKPAAKKPAPKKAAPKKEDSDGS